MLTTGVNSNVRSLIDSDSKFTEKSKNTADFTRDLHDESRQNASFAQHIAAHCDSIEASIIPVNKDDNQNMELFSNNFNGSVAPELLESSKDPISSLAKGKNMATVNTTYQDYDAQQNFSELAKQVSKDDLIIQD